MQPSIHAQDPTAADARALLEAHLLFANRVTPTGHVHALDHLGLQNSDVSFFGARSAGVLVGIGALRELEPTHGELKSMHTSETARRRGIGRAMLQHLLSLAAQRGYHQVSLETGAGDAFAPSRALYASFGFEPCPPFADYADNEFSVCMSLLLDSNDPTDSRTD